MIEIKQTETYRKSEHKLKDHKARVFRLANGLPGDLSPVGQGISELRIHYGPGYRIYFKQNRNEIVILLCGGDKSTQNKDIESEKGNPTLKTTLAMMRAIGVDITAKAHIARA